ncbi:MAG: hypothetical protein R3Y63_09835 [Eubacteriales bacterium]
MTERNVPSSKTAVLQNQGSPKTRHPSKPVAELVVQSNNSYRLTEKVSDELVQ